MNSFMFHHMFHSIRHILPALQPSHINAFSHSISSHAHTFCRRIHEYLWVAADFFAVKSRGQHLVDFSSWEEKWRARQRNARQQRRKGSCLHADSEPKKITFYQHCLIRRSLSHQTAFKRMNHPLYTSFNQLILQWAERWQAWFIKHGALSK